MAVKSIAERIYSAYLTGNEALFFEDGITYEFTPQGLKDFITSTSQSVSWDDITDKPTLYPFEQLEAISDATSEQEAVTSLNDLLAGLRTAGILKE